jgi:SAM-dependent methyltransferase
LGKEFDLSDNSLQAPVRDWSSIPFDKYYYYSLSVQSTEADVDFLQQVYQEWRGKKATTLREDFCGTFQLCTAWVNADPAHVAYGVDLDPEPLAYGRAHNLSTLDAAQQQRVHIVQGNVLEYSPPLADIVVALNFSYFIFKRRDYLKRYFAKIYSTLAADGVLFLDCFGGSQCGEANEEETEDDDLSYSYYWDQESFDPISNEAVFHIHFRRYGEKKRHKVFSYDWRLWSIPELRDILAEVGFRTSHVYWEGNDEDGDGNGEFTRVEKGEECDAWVAYLVALK